MADAAESAPESEPGVTFDDDLIVISNRQPYRHRYECNSGKRKLVVDRPTGGLVAGLDPVLQRIGGTWIAWGDGDADEAVADRHGIVEVPPDSPKYSLQHVYLDEEIVRDYYNGYANQTLWPLFHSVLGSIQIDRTYWDQYRTANEEFASTAVRHISNDSIVWVQDYHLALAPKMLRNEVDPFLMHFWHIPWPSAEIFQICPHHQELLLGLLANDLLGFHVPRYCDNFLSCVDRFVPDAVVDRTQGIIHNENGVTRVKSFPLGVDVRKIEEHAKNADSSASNFRQRHGIDTNCQIILGVDRLDYTKGIPERLASLEQLLESQPELLGSITYVQKATDSRSEVPAYQELQRTVDQTVTRINHRFETGDWKPVVLTKEFLPFDELCELYRAADVALVTPLRDGMNLVAHEYVAAQVDTEGTLVLSQFAGANDILGEHSYSVNPRDTHACAISIKRALCASKSEQRKRMHSLRNEVLKLDINRWIASILESAQAIQQTPEISLGEAPM